MFNFILSLVLITVTGCTTLKSDRCSFSKPLNEVEKEAHKGSPQALNMLGEMYHFGCGVKQDLKRAHNYYLLAAEKGSAVAANHLGRLYANGEGVTADVQQAEKWYKKSVELDPSDENRCYNLHPTPSFCALLELAHAGNPQAMTAIGEAYLNGVFHGQKQIVFPNPSYAKKWFIKAAEQNNPTACWMLYTSCKRGAIPCEGPQEIEKWKSKGLQSGGEPLDFQ